MERFDRKSKMDKRTNQRKSYSGDIFFVAKNGFNEGRLKNFSRTGLFISSKSCLTVGDIITIAIPFLKNKKAKIRGQILRRNREGFGIELFKDRSAANRIMLK